MLGRFVAGLDADVLLARRRSLRSGRRCRSCSGSRIRTSGSARFRSPRCSASVWRRSGASRVRRLAGRRRASSSPSTCGRRHRSAEAAQSTSFRRRSTRSSRANRTLPSRFRELQPYVLTVADVYAYKNLGVLVDAVARLGRSDLRLVIAGRRIERAEAEPAASAGQRISWPLTRSCFSGGSARRMPGLYRRRVLRVRIAHRELRLPAARGDGVWRPGCVREGKRDAVGPRRRSRVVRRRATPRTQRTVIARLLDDERGGAGGRHSGLGAGRRYDAARPVPPLWRCFATAAAYHRSRDRRERSSSGRRRARSCGRTPRTRSRRGRSRACARGRCSPTRTRCRRSRVIVAAHDEEPVIERRVANLRELDYPSDRLELVVTSDASTDRTEELAEARRRPRDPQSARRQGGRAGQRRAPDARATSSPSPTRTAPGRPTRCGSSSAPSPTRTSRTSADGSTSSPDDGAQQGGPLLALRARAARRRVAHRLRHRRQRLDLRGAPRGLSRGRPALRPRPLVPVPDGAARPPRGVRAGGERLREGDADERGRVPPQGADVRALLGDRGRGEDAAAPAAALLRRGRVAPASPLRAAACCTSCCSRRRSRCSATPLYQVALGLQLGLLAAAAVGVGVARYYVLVTWATLEALVKYLRRGVPTTWEAAEGTR